jgi:tryptophan synthase alpha chain
MSFINNYIEEINSKGRKILSIFLTAGYPDVKGFTHFAKAVLDAGADMLEIGIPFSDPLADGPVIQNSSQTAIANGVNIRMVFNFSEEISKYSTKPVILMGYANPLLNYGTSNFFRDALNSGAKGIIIPDVPVEEYDDFFNGKPKDLKAILLAAPTSDRKRIKAIDDKSEGFVYCVSMAGTTGNRNNSSLITSIETTRTLVKKNKMMIGFGISTPEDVIKYSPFCDGVIIGSAVIKSLNEKGIKNTLGLIERLSEAV